MDKYTVILLQSQNFTEPTMGCIISLQEKKNKGCNAMIGCARTIRNRVTSYIPRTFFWVRQLIKQGQKKGMMQKKKWTKCGQIIRVTQDEALDSSAPIHTIFLCLCDQTKSPQTFMDHQSSLQPYSFLVLYCFWWITYTIQLIEHRIDHIVYSKRP